MRRKIKLFLQHGGQKQIDLVLIFTCAIFYFIMSALLRRFSLVSEHININGLIIDAAAVRGILAQFQMLLSVYLILKDTYIGYFTAIFLNIYGLSMSLLAIFISKTSTSIPGIISYSGVIIIIRLIFQYRKKVKEQISRIEQQKQDIMDSEARYQEQNILLTEQYKKLKEQEKELKQMAYFDGLTNVLNRRMFIKELTMQVDVAKKLNRKLFVVFIDIDDFKMINDTMGHYAGDNVLKGITSRIKSVIHEEDIIGRLGGDEIALIITQSIEEGKLKKYIEQIREEIIKPFETEQEQFSVTASFGIVEYPQYSNNAIELLKKADIAMYQSKNSGKNQIVFYE